MNIKHIRKFPEYKITDQGVIIGKRGLQLKSRDNGVYQYAFLFKDGQRYVKSIHHLVLENFSESRPDGKEANHKDGDKFNNWVENLEWVTRSENMRHAFMIGLINRKKGESHHNSKLRLGEVKLIRKILKGKTMTQWSIAQMFNVSPMAISRIKHRKRWNHL